MTLKNTPICPQCNEPMVIRTANKGENTGKQFFVCPNYKDCHQFILVPNQNQSSSSRKRQEKKQTTNKENINTRKIACGVFLGVIAAFVCISCAIMAVNLGWLALLFKGISPTTSPYITPTPPGIIFSFLF